ncbi:hypothetical protein [Staphylococcus hominis]
MKKIINILLIAILSAVLIGLVLFVINFGKDILTKNSTETKNIANNQNTDKKPNQAQTTQDKEKIEAPQESTNDLNINTNATEKTTDSQIVSNEKPTTEEVETDEYGQEVHRTKNGFEYGGKKKSPAEEDQFEQEIKSQTGGAPTPDNMKITLSELRETLKDVYDTPEELDKTMKEAKESGDYIDDGSED